MSEKINPELNNEELLEPVAEDAEKALSADEAENTAENTAEAAEAATEQLTAEADTVESAVQNETTAIADDTASSEELVDISKTAAEPTAESAKKKRTLQVPVIIACCIVLAAILGFLAYMAFFLKEPENVTWSNTIDDTTYYYEFKTDGTFKAYIGSIEMTGSFQKSKTDEGNTITVDKTIGSFYQSMPATYKISGSKLFGNQVMTCTYSEDYEFTLNQSKREKNLLDLPENFTANEDLLGSWIFKYMNYDIYKVTFNKDGSMILEFIQDGLQYNGVYTIEDNTINFTYYATESVVVPIEYKVDGDNLTFMGYNFVREGSEAANATSDQQLVPVEETAAATE